jgi:hypothetical protein
MNTKKNATIAICLTAILALSKTQPGSEQGVIAVDVGWTPVVSKRCV